MNIAIYASAGAAVLAALVAVGLFIAGEMRRARAARREQRRAMIVRMLDVLDAVVKGQAKPSVVRALRSPDVEVTLSMQRLLLDLAKEELAISAWIWSRVQQMTLTTDRAAYVSVAVEIQGKLISWYRQDIPLDWFEAQVASRPPIDKYKIPRRIQWIRALKSVPETAQLLGAGALALFTAGWLVSRKAPR